MSEDIDKIKAEIMWADAKGVIPPPMALYRVERIINQFEIEISSLKAQIAAKDKEIIGLIAGQATLREALEIETEIFDKYKNKAEVELAELQVKFHELSQRLGIEIK